MKKKIMYFRQLKKYLLEDIYFTIFYIPIIFSKLDKTLIHRGAFNEIYEEHYKDLRKLYLNLPIEPGKNTIVSSHNGVINENMFDSTVLENDMYRLEEGGFYIISVKDGRLVLEHRFYYFKDFIIYFYPREY